MGNKAWWGATVLVTLGAAALAFNVSAGNNGVTPPIPQDQAAVTQNPASAQTLVATGAVQAPSGPAVSVADGRANARVDLGTQRSPQATSPEMLKRAQVLREADVTATRGQGPAEACLAQIKMIFCPIIGNMPFIRDVAGQVAMWGHFDCPTGTPPKS